MEYVATNATEALGFWPTPSFKHEVSEARDNFTYYLLATDRPRAAPFRTLDARDLGVAAARPCGGSGRDGRASSSSARGAGSGARRRRGSLAIVLDPTGALLRCRSIRSPRVTP
jgi:hypothetical protein